MNVRSAKALEIREIDEVAPDSGSVPTRVTVDTWPKVCHCGASWTEDDWSSLPLLGHFPNDQPELEMRTCSCRSTLAVTLA